MKKLSFDYSKALGYVREEELSFMKEQVLTAEKFLKEKNGAGNDFLGWIELPTNYDKAEFERIKAAAEKIKKDSDILLVVGIGGSYLGARAAIDFLSHTFYNNLPKDKRKGTEIFYVGNNISGVYLKHLLDILEGKDYSINVISKSGTTTEPAIAFRVLKKHIEEKYGRAEARNRIYATTDKVKGALKKLADEEGYETFVIPDDVGGRYSVITPVGLLPMAILGIDIKEVMSGLNQAYVDLQNDSLKDNAAYAYAVARRILQDKGFDVEMLVTYEPNMTLVGEWWKQLFGESEGKDGKGVFPASATYSTDLHSLGQFVQDGKKVLFETLLLIEKPMLDMKFPFDEADEDKMNYLSGKSLDWVNKMAYQGTLEAHEVTGGVSNLILTMEDNSAYSFGYMCYFFFKACAMTCYMLDINPFNQPGVEVYKKNMFKLLGKN